jgi:uncharacterized protein YkwD
MIAAARALVTAVAAPALATADSAPLARPATLDWVAWTASPAVISEATSARDAELLAHCGSGEAGLREAARRIAMSRLPGSARIDLDRLDVVLRASGEPHVWPRAWVVTGHALDHDATLAKMDAWRASFHDEGERRCGVASARASDGTEVIAAVAVFALADLAPVAVRAHAGSWLTIDATLLVPTEDAHVVVQEGDSDPRRVPSWTRMENGEPHLVARFAPDHTGDLTMQVVADVATGPRPILEARVFADVDPPARLEATPAPGEGAIATAVAAGGDASDALYAMVASLREAEHLPGLVRDTRLDAVARAHARRMLAAHVVGHDVGDGDPAERTRAAGLHPHLVGENVAHAAGVRLAHRALFESPSHRANLLRDDFTSIGTAVVADADGSVWVAEVMAAGL